MKFNNNHSNAVISGAVSAPQNFTIQTSKAMFLLLSSALYNNKIGACIRELSCNAYDAHVDAGKKDTPFEIHFPTSFEPWFTVKDFGTGLEHGEAPSSDNEFKGSGVLGLYCSYGGTTKSDSNDAIGCFGVGSKSPFCYTEGFTVTSRFKGVTRIYSAYITEQGTPSIVLQTEEATPKAPNGLEVTFPVKEDDCWEFENNARNALEFFNPRPKLNIELEIATQNYIMKTDRWGMRDKEDTQQGSGVRAIQGMVPYSVGKIDVSKLSPELQKLMEMPLDIFFPIGELAVAASRETLQLDPITVANITGALENVYTGLVTEIKKEIDKCQQPWEARLLIFRLENAPGTGKIISRAFDKGELFGQYKNFNFNGKKPALNELDYIYTQVYKFKKKTNYHSTPKYAEKSFVFARSSQEHQELAAMELSNGTKKRKDFDREFDVEPNVTFVINDMKHGGEKYIHYFLQEAVDNREKLSDDGDVITNHKTVVYLMARRAAGIVPAQVMKESAAMVTKLGNPTFILLSDMKAKYGQFCDVIAEKKPHVPKERREVVEMDMNAMQGTNRYNGAWSRTWKRSGDIKDGIKYYLVVEDNKAPESGFHNARTLIEFVAHVKDSKAFGLNPHTPVYGLKPKSPLRLLTTEWVELTSHVMTQVPLVMTHSKELEMSIVLKPFRTREWEDELKSILKDKTFPHASPMKQFLVSLDDAQKAGNTPENEALKGVLDEAKKRQDINGADVYKEHNTVNFQNAWDQVMKIYPMLKMSSRSYYMDSPKKVVADYVRLVDAANEAKSVPALGDSTIEDRELVAV